MSALDKLQKLDDEITYYFNDERAERALVLHAAWGSGKSYLLKKWLDHRKNEMSGKLDIAYISVFGVKSSDELHERAVSAFIELAPIGKSPQGTLNLLRTIASTQKVNLPPISNTSLLRFVTKPRAIVIDDVERVSGPLGEIFGAINEFIERHHVKVILVCDREKLRVKEQYTEIEKIADTILPFPAATQSTIEEMVSDTLESVEEIFQHEKDICEAVEHSKTKNIGTVSKTLATYRRLCSVLEKNPPDNGDNLGKLAYAIIAYGIEHYDARRSYSGRDWKVILFG